MRNAINIRLLPALLLAAFGLPMLATAGGLPALTNTCIGQNFDGVTAPALPAGWTTTVSTGAPTTAPWKTRTIGYSDSGTNTAFLDDTLDYADVSLYSSTFSVNSTQTPYVTFRQSYYLWTAEASPTNNGAYNGGVLEVSVNGGPFADLITAGGSFYVGGYNSTLDPAFPNPIDQPAGSRAVWSGDSGGFVTTTAIMPASAVGGTVQLRWRLGTEGGSRSYDTHSGWWIDSLQTQALNTVSDYVFTDGFEGPCN